MIVSFRWSQLLIVWVTRRINAANNGARRSTSVEVAERGIMNTMGLDSCRYLIYLQNRPILSLFVKDLTERTLSLWKWPSVKWNIISCNIQIEYVSSHWVIIPWQNQWRNGVSIFGLDLWPRGSWTPTVALMKIIRFLNGCSFSL